MGKEFNPVSFYFSHPMKSAGMTVPGPAISRDRDVHLRSRGFTLMGLPTIVAQATVGPGADPGQLDARLWDIFAGRQRLISRTGYQLEGHGREQVVFQLHGNGYRFAPGHVIQLKLLGEDTPYYRTSPGGPAVEIHGLTMVVPTLERPNGQQILAPDSAPLPAPGEPGFRTTQGVRVRQR